MAEIGTPTPHLLTSIGMLDFIAPIYGNPNGGVHQITNSVKSKILPHTGLKLIHSIVKIK